MEKKVCRQCRKLLPVIKFDAHQAPQGSRYFVNCKACNVKRRTQRSDYYYRNRERELLKVREWRKNNKETVSRMRKEHREKTKKQQRAHDVIEKSIDYGFIQNPGVCSINTERCCGRIDGHHANYNKPSEVQWLCQAHHRAWHRIFIPTAIFLLCLINSVVHAMPANDPLYPLQWQYQRMGSEKAWNKVNHTDVKVAVIDTGVSAHPDLNQSIKGGYNAINNSSDFRDDNQHGSHCGGIVCGHSNNSLGITGSAWSCSLYGVKFLQANGSGSLFDAIRAIDWSIVNGVRIISASWGGGGFSQPLYDAIGRARGAGILFIAAAGNEGRNTDQVANYPSGYDLDNVISVGSIDKDGKLSYFSNFGNQSVDLVAPGGSILSTNNSNGYVTLSGTSMAAPAASGVAALIWQQNPSLTYLEVKQRLFANAKPRPNMKVKYGELQADSFDSTPCDPKKLKLCYDGCKATFPNQTYKRRLCRRACREQYSCEVGALTWAKEQLGLD